MHYVESNRKTRRLTGLLIYLRVLSFDVRVLVYHILQPLLRGR